jgi:sulfur carrier protein
MRAGVGSPSRVLNRAADQRRRLPTMDCVVPSDMQPVKQRIIVNGEAVETSARDLASLLAELGYADQPVATALDGTFIPAAGRADARLTQGVRIEIVAPRQGG